MPTPSLDFSFACIYGLEFDYQCLYVGSTANRNQRALNHKYAFSKQPYGCLPKQLRSLTDNWDDIKFYIIEEYSITDGTPKEMRIKLEQRELEWINIINPYFNIKQPALSKEIQKENKNKKNRENEHYKEYHREYQEKNRDRLNERHREYYIENKEHLDQLNKKYYEENKDKVKEYKKQYYENNKEILAVKQHEIYLANIDKRKELNKVKWTCPDCKNECQLVKKSRHLKTCKGVPKIVDPATQIECHICHQLVGKKHKARHFKTCKALSIKELC